MRTRTWVGAAAVILIVLAAVGSAILLIRNRSPDSAVPLLTVVEVVGVTPSTPPVASPTVPEPLVYVVEEGDTLSGIARAHGVSLQDLIAANDLENPDVLRIGQTLVIPRAGLSDATAVASPTVSARRTPLPTLTASGPPLIEIGEVMGAGNLPAEMVTVRNRGGMASLERWTLSNAAGDTFVFPALTLFPNAQVRVHSAAGTDSPSDVHWGREEPAWSSGGVITLRDASGNVVDTHVVP